MKFSMIDNPNLPDKQVWIDDGRTQYVKLEGNTITANVPKDMTIRELKQVLLFVCQNKVFALNKYLDNQKRVL